jgi:hypothetical protein
MNYENIITIEDLKKITNEKFEFITKETERQILICEQIRKKRFNNPFSIKIQVEKNVESFCKSEDKAVKNIICANTLYYNTSNVINALLNKNITYNILYKSLYFVDELKKGENLTKNAIIANKNIKALYLILQTYFGWDDFNLIITRLTYIAVYEKDLYEALEKKHKIKTL